MSVGSVCCLLTFSYPPFFTLTIGIACALLWNDEATLSSVSRWFMQEYQFVTDAYRLTTVVHRLCNATTTWYNCAPTQKYLLRQLKAMDFPLVGEEQKLAFPAGRAGYATKDESGNLVMASGMDVALLMLYGHLLYCGRSFTAALSKSARHDESFVGSIPRG